MSEEHATNVLNPSANGVVSDTGHRELKSEDTVIVSARQAEIEAKQTRIGELLADAAAEGMLLLDPANVAWLCGAALHKEIPEPSEWPAVYLTTSQRWIVASNADSQRLFDVHLDELGFQLKEWPWHNGRDRLLGDLCGTRRIASDRLLNSCVPMGPVLRRLRCLLTEGERERLRQLGAAVSHALEATCRTLEAGQSEQEIAGQLGHRLLHHGVTPVTLTVAGDGRPRRHRRPGVTTATVQHTCVVAAIASQGGLHLAASRTVCLGTKGQNVRQEFDGACRIQAAHAADGIASVLVRDVLSDGRRAAAASGVEHSWRDLPPGYVTGWLPVERPFLPSMEIPLEAGWAVVWQSAVGEALIMDSFLIDAGTAACVTPVENWPVKRIQVHGRAIDVPDILVRE